MGLKKTTEQRPETERERESVRAKDTPSNKIIAIFTALLFIASVFQWQRIGQQIASSEKIASDNSKDTQAALNVSESLANSAAEQVAAMKDLAAAQRIEAGATAQEARAAGQELALRQISNIDVVIDPEPYTEQSTEFVGVATISNQGTYTVRNAHVYVANTFWFVTHDIRNIWNQLRPAGTIDIVPGIPHTFKIVLPKESAESRWIALKGGVLRVVHAVRVVFRDTAGHTQTIDRCIMYGGEPPGNVYDRDCQNLR